MLPKHWVGGTVVCVVSFCDVLGGFKKGICFTEWLGKVRYYWISKYCAKSNAEKKMKGSVVSVSFNALKYRFYSTENIHEKFTYVDFCRIIVPRHYLFFVGFFLKKITYFSSKKWRCYVQMLMLKYFMLRKSVHVQCMVNIITIERLNYSLCWLFFINDELIKLRRWWESHYIIIFSLSKLLTV